MVSKSTSMISKSTSMIFETINANNDSISSIQTKGHSFSNGEYTKVNEFVPKEWDAGVIPTRDIFYPKGVIKEIEATGRETSSWNDTRKPACN